MFTKEQIHAQMREMGISPSDLVTAHTSLRAVGEVEGRGEGFLDILRDYFDENGILTIPTHTWSNIGKDIPTMDVSKPEEICIGTLPKIAAACADGIRALHPSHSMMAFSKTPANAAKFVAGAIMADSATGPTTCYGRLYYQGGKVLLIGVGHNRNTYLHAVEEIVGTPNRMSPELRPLSVKIASGDVLARPMHCHSAVGIGDVSQYYPKLEPLFEKAGAIKRGKIGNADTMFCDCRIMHDVYKKLHEEHPEELFSNHDPIPAEWY